jgi:hypothetical protein
MSFLLVIAVEYAENLGMNKRTNGVEHSANETTSNGNVDDPFKQHLVDLIDKF